MPDYKAMYFRMAHETERATDFIATAMEILVEVQKECEEMYINAEEPELVVLNFSENETPDGDGPENDSIENNAKTL